MKLFVTVFVVVLVAAGALVAWYAVRSHAREAEVERLLVEVQPVLDKKLTDRDSGAKALFRLRAAATPGSDRRIVRACARAEILAGESKRAAERLEAAIGDRRPAPEDARVLGQAYERLFCLSGDPELGRRSLASLAQAAEELGERDDQYRAYRMASRIKDDAAAESHAKRVLEGEDSPAKKRIEASKMVEEGRFDTALEALAQLEDAFASEPELQLEIAQCLLRRTGTGVAELERAREALEQAVRGYPFLVQARSAAATVYHALGKKDLRDAHLDWCLANAPDHPLWTDWKALREGPAGTR